MTIYAFLLITRPGIDHVTVSKHSTTFVWNEKEIAMAFLALVIPKRGIGILPLFLVVILALEKMDEDVLGTVKGFGIEEVKGVVGSRKMTIHAVGNKPLFIVHMCGGFPGVVGKLNFMAGCTEIGGRGSDHGVVSDAEKR